MDLSSRSERLMGTTITVSICDPQADELLTHCFELLRSYEHRFSANDASSELMEINHQAGIAPVQVHPDLFELIALGTLHSQAKNSHLNIAIGPLVQTWRIGFSDARRPAPEEIEQALLKIDPQQIQLDQENYTVFLKRPGMKIDLGALAKGYSADLIATYLRGKGIKDALIDLGGNILTVDQINMFLKAMPFELTYADDNNQFLYYNNAHQDPDTMFAKRVPPQSGSRMSTVHGSLPPARMKNVEWVIGTLRNGNQEYVRTIVPGSPEGVINTHNYQAMYYEDGSYAGINEIVFNFKPWLDWYLQTTGQRLVGGSGPFAPAGGHGSADATSGASDAGGHGDGGHGDADATSGASN